MPTLEEAAQLSPHDAKVLRNNRDEVIARTGAIDPAVARMAQVLTAALPDIPAGLIARVLLADKQALIFILRDGQELEIAEVVETGLGMLVAAELAKDQL